MIKLDVEVINKCFLSVDTKGDYREYLKGIQIKDVDGFRYYTATDGHTLFSVKTEIDEDSLDKEYILKIENPIKDKIAFVEMIKVDDDTVVLKGLKKIAVDVIDCTYPEWERIVPSDSTPLASQYCMFDPKQIEKLNKFIPDAYLKRPLQEDYKSPTKWFINENGKEYTAVVMPVLIK